MIYPIILHETIRTFESKMLSKAGQEKRTNKHGPWRNIAEKYIVQKERLMYYPYPEEFNNNIEDEEFTQIIKPIPRLFTKIFKTLLITYVPSILSIVIPHLKSEKRVQKKGSLCYV